MHDEDAEKCLLSLHKVHIVIELCLFRLKNAGVTYMRAMTVMFHDMMHKEIEVYVDNVIIKSKKQSNHVQDLRRFFKRLCRYNVKLNNANICVWIMIRLAFGVYSKSMRHQVRYFKNKSHSGIATSKEQN